MNLDWQKVGIKKLAAIISVHLQKNGIEVVLVGGACVSLYSNNQYMSYNIDFFKPWGSQNFLFLDYRYYYWKVS